MQDAPEIDIGLLDFSKLPDQLIPAIVQHHINGQVLMLGYMNLEALQATISSGKVTFFSRSKGRLWTKGESSGNFLKYISASADCDQDALLVQADPCGPTCHNGSQSCFGNQSQNLLGILTRIEGIIKQRRDSPASDSYSSQLMSSSLARVAQKVGEEGVEVAIASVAGSESEFIGEAADLIFHLLALLVRKNIGFESVLAELKSRNIIKKNSQS